MVNTIVAKNRERGVARPHAKRPRLPAITDTGAFEFVR
jgi:hypothetical protein